MNAHTDLVVIKRILTGIFLILAAYAIFIAQDVIMPIVLGFLIALTLRPVVRAAEARGVPAPVTAVLIVPLVTAVIGVGAYSLSGPVSELVASAPRVGRQLEIKFAEYRDEIKAVQDASEQVEKIARFRSYYRVMGPLHRALLAGSIAVGPMIGASMLRQRGSLLGRLLRALRA